MSGFFMLNFNLLDRSISDVDMKYSKIYFTILIALISLLLATTINGALCQTRF